jgi:hypothetical protein
MMTQTKEIEDGRIREAIVGLLEKRDVGKTICPSEASREVFGKKGNEREYMDRTRDVVRALAREGEIEVCQKGSVVDMDAVKGPIRLRMKS